MYDYTHTFRVTKPLFWKYVSDEDYAKIGRASSESDAIEGVLHFVGSFEPHFQADVQERNNGYFVTIS